MLVGRKVWPRLGTNGVTRVKLKTRHNGKLRKLQDAHFEAGMDLELAAMDYVTAHDLHVGEGFGAPTTAAQ
jgi:hypothetical protein